MKFMSAREAALKALFEINEKDAYSNIVVNNYITQVEDIDRSLFTELVYGVIRWKLTIDTIIEIHSSIKFKKMSKWILNIIRLGVLQIIFMDKIPLSAACNESVKLAKKYGHKASAGFVNAILRKISKVNLNDILDKYKKDLVEYFSFKYSHPKWMVEKWLKDYGKEFTEQLLIANNTIPNFTIRINKLKIKKKDFEELMENINIESTNDKYVNDALTIKKPMSLLTSETFSKGYFYVQDESSMIAVNVLDPKPGEFIVDVCSAPGGKCTYIAEIMNNHGTVLARDIYENKLKMINDTAIRLGINIIKVECFDALNLDESLVGKADRVLVDAPCSGLGIIRRKPEIKWAKTPSDILELSKIQKRILSTCSNYVKPGGVLVYSTCTIGTQENEEMVYTFLDENKDFELLDISDFLSKDISSNTPVLQLFPNVHGVDGFFIAKMKRLDKNQLKN